MELVIAMTAVSAAILIGFGALGEDDRVLLHESLLHDRSDVREVHVIEAGEEVGIAEDLEIHDPVCYQIPRLRTNLNLPIARL